MVAYNVSQSNMSVNNFERNFERMLYNMVAW
jgi:hypothetical protein